jgi:hypothetical protein
MLAEFSLVQGAAVGIAARSVGFGVAESKKIKICCFCSPTTTHRPAITTADSRSTLNFASIKSRAAPNSDLCSGEAAFCAIDALLHNIKFSIFDCTLSIDALGLQTRVDFGQLNQNTVF